MEQLVGRLAALDPDAGAAIRVIAYFDRLAESRAGLEALVRGAAVLAGCPARLVDPERHVRVRVEQDGTRNDADPPPPDPGWPHMPLAAGHPATLWLERIRAEADAPSVVDAVILERAAGAVRQVLDRTRGRAHVLDAALVETVLDAEADEQSRLLAARRLGLDTADPVGPGATRYRAVAELGGNPRILTADADLPPGRLGVGMAVPVLGLPRSWAAARKALRFTASGTAHDPGGRVVRAEELGDIALLEALVVPGAEPPPDVSALELAIADAPWMPVTLHAVVTTTSLRAAASEINVHHSTLQARIAHAEALLGWSLHTPHGLLRLHIALILRHLAQTGTASA